MLPTKDESRTMLLTTRMDRSANTMTPHWSGKSSRKIVAIGPVDKRSELTELFRARGWEVLTALTGKETRKVAIKGGANLVILPARGEPESGWMSCLKLMKTGKKRRVILCGEMGDSEAECFAKYAGAAAYLTPEDGLESIWDMGTTPRSQTVLS